MAGYTTVETLKERLAIPAPDSASDAMLEATIAAASREIDNYCGRRFYSTATDETRFYTATSARSVLLPDDLLTVTELATDDGTRTYTTVWPATDYDLAPANQTPHWEIRARWSGNHSFPAGLDRGVRVTGRFGYCQTGSHPADIEMACLIRSAQMLGLAVAPFGQVGLGETTSVPVSFGAFRGLLDPYRIIRVG